MCVAAVTYLFLWKCNASAKDNVKITTGDRHVMKSIKKLSQRPQRQCESAVIIGQIALSTGVSLFNTFVRGEAINHDLEI